MIYHSSYYYCVLNLPSIWIVDESAFIYIWVYSNHYCYYFRESLSANRMTDKVTYKMIDISR